MKEIIEKLNNIKNKIIEEKTTGKLRFLGLIARADIEGKWDLLVSADWIKKNSSEDDFVYIIQKLKDNFDEKLDFLARIVLLTPKEAFIQQLARAIIRENGGEAGKITSLKTSKDFIVGQIVVIAFDFTDIGLDVSQETEDGPVGIKDIVNF